MGITLFIRRKEFISTLAEHCTGASSASCYTFDIDFRILLIVMPERNLYQIQWQIILTALVITADHARLEQASKAI